MKVDFNFQNVILKRDSSIFMCKLFIYFLFSIYLETGLTCACPKVLVMVQHLHHAPATSFLLYVTMIQSFL